MPSSSRRSAATEAAHEAHDALDPDPWEVLCRERSLPLDSAVKQALADSHGSWSRRRLYPWVRAFALALIALAGALRLLLPERVACYRLLHGVVVHGLRCFALPQTNWLILRHFQIGSQILQFLADNLADGRTLAPAQAPRTLRELLPNGFLDHDLNLYRVVDGLNRHADMGRIQPRPPAALDFSALQPPDIHEPACAGRRWHHVLDLHSAVELIVPLYALCLPRRECFRAAHSLQLDETIAVYVAQLLGQEHALVYLHNRMPWLPLPLAGAGTRLLAHGIGTEVMYEALCRLRDRPGI